MIQQHCALEEYYLTTILTTCARVRQLKRTELAWRVGSAQCLRSPHKLKICGGPERSNRTAKQIVRPLGAQEEKVASKNYSKL